MIKENVLLVIAFIGLATAWHIHYVKPADEMRWLIYDCMVETGDESQQGYTFCKNSLKPQ